MSIRHRVAFFVLASFSAIAPALGDEAERILAAAPSGESYGRHLLFLTEEPHPADKDSRLYEDPTQVAYHGYAPSGKVRAEVVYANGGSP
jgi:hypothetical protein